MSELLTDFLLLRDPTVRWVVLSVCFMSVASALAGCFAYLRKEALLGDAVSHSVLPGVALAFIIVGYKSELPLLGGAIVTGYLSLLAIRYIQRNTKLKADAALALVLSSFYAVGIVLLSYIQKMPLGTQSGLESYLFGKAAAMGRDDILIYSSLAAIVVGAVFLFYKPFQLLIFDSGYAEAAGIPVRIYNVILQLLLVVAISLGLQSVGIVLMAAMLITPPAAARYWTHSLNRMLLLSAMFAAGSAYIGIFISYWYPAMPTGPWIVSIMSVLALGSVIVGTEKGVLYDLRLSRRNRKKIRTENLLKHLLKSGGTLSTLAVAEETGAPKAQLKALLKGMQKRGLLLLKGEVKLTPAGEVEAKRIVRLHRLWELYLTNYMKLPADHVHDDAEAIEHIITPEVEERLITLLKRPKLDPHQSQVPY